MKTVQETVDVIVAGGGTAGHVAAIQAARAGATTSVVEAGSMLGGTMTAGGVYMPNHFFSTDGPVVLGIAYLLLAMRESLWCWYAAFGSTAIFLFLFWDVRLLMEAALQVYYLAMAVYGWWQWRHGGAAGEALSISRWGARQHLLALIATLALAAVLLVGSGAIALAILLFFEFTLVLGLRGMTLADYFETLSPTWQTWHAQRSAGTLGPHEQAAASRAAKRSRISLPPEHSTAIVRTRI